VTKTPGDSYDSGARWSNRHSCHGGSSLLKLEMPISIPHPDKQFLLTCYI